MFFTHKSQSPDTKIRNEFVKLIESVVKMWGS